MIFTAYMSKSAHTYFGYCEIDNNYGISAAVDLLWLSLYSSGNWLLLPSSKCERGGAGVDRNPYQISKLYGKIKLSRLRQLGNLKLPVSDPIEVRVAA